VHHGLLIGQPRTRQPSPFQARVAHIDDQYHADPIALPECPAGTVTGEKARKDSIPDRPISAQATRAHIMIAPLALAPFHGELR
jgi:hypothetical protein